MATGTNHIADMALIREVETSPLCNIYKTLDIQTGAVRIVKRLRPDKTRHEQLFRREPTLLATLELNHPNIVRFFGYRPAEKAFVLEYVWGRTLESVLRQQGAIAPAGAAALGVEVCRALSAIHQHRVVHCDVKPANILLGYDGTVKLIDFGVAQAPVLGESRLLGGTPSYMAPEQLHAHGTHRSAAAIGPAADLFALGVVLFEAVSGRKPFTDRDRGNPAPPLRSLRADVPGGLHEIVMALLDTDPARRPQSAEEAGKVLGAGPGMPEMPDAQAARRRARIAALALEGSGDRALTELLENIDALLGRQKLPQARFLLERAEQLAPAHPAVRQRARRAEQLAAAEPPFAPVFVDGGATPVRVGRHPRILLWVLAAAGVALVLAASAAYPLYMLFSVRDFHVVVLDPAGNPVADTELTMVPRRGGTSLHGRTSSAGAFSFARVWPGNYELQARAPGFLPARRFVDAPAGDATTLPLQPEQRGTLAAHVTLLAGGGEQAADWVLVNNERREAEGGVVRVPFRAGQWDFHFGRPGFDTYTARDISITEGGVAELRVALRRSGEAAPVADSPEPVPAFTPEPPAAAEAREAWQAAMQARAETASDPADFAAIPAAPEPVQPPPAAVAPAGVRIVTPIGYDHRQGGERGIRVECELEPGNLTGSRVEVAAYFHDAAGNPLEDRDGDHASSRGQVYVGEYLNLPATATAPQRVSLFLPGRQLDLARAGPHQIQVRVCLWNYSGGAGVQEAETPLVSLVYDVSRDEVMPAPDSRESIAEAWSAAAETRPERPGPRPAPPPPPPRAPVAPEVRDVVSVWSQAVEDRR